jgi:hypothetical protein
MKRFVKKILLLGLLLLFIILVLNYFGVKAGNIYKDGAALVCETKREMVRSGEVNGVKGKINVLFMGSSRILAGIVPTYFDQLSGGKTFSFNLALPALPISSSYFVLQDYLVKNPPPGYVVMELYINTCKNCTVLNYYANQGPGGVGEMTSLFMNLEDKSIIINYFFPFKMYKFFVFQYFFDLISRPAHISKIMEKNRLILNRMKKERGYYFIEEQAVTEDRLLQAKFAKKKRSIIKKGIVYDPFIDPYTKKFFDLTFEKNIKVMLIQPVFREKQSLQYEEMPLQFASILKRYSNVYMANEGWKLKFYERRFFGDITHLDKDGALMYTKEIFTEFNEVFPIVFSHKGTQRNTKEKKIMKSFWKSRNLFSKRFLAAGGKGVTNEENDCYRVQWTDRQ